MPLQKIQQPTIIMVYSRASSSCLSHGWDQCLMFKGKIPHSGRHSSLQPGMQMNSDRLHVNAQEYPARDRQTPRNTLSHAFHTRGRSRENSDQFPKQQLPKMRVSKGVQGHAPQESVSILTSYSPLSWVSKSF